jgi:hypothetical protein
MEKIIIPLGILTYLMVLITVFSGIRKVKIQNHKILAGITALLATTHAGIVIYLNYFSR